MCSKSDLQKILHELAELYTEVYGDAVERILLYGSYARGDYDEYSDIDVVAIVRGDRLELQNQLKKVWHRAGRMSLEYDTIISPTVIPFDEFEYWKEDLPYYMNIEKEGVPIVA